MQEIKMFEELKILFDITNTEIDFSDERLFEYNAFKKQTKNKLRTIEEPNEKLKQVQRNISYFLVKTYERPAYYFSIWGNTSNILNAKQHCNNHYTMTLDIASFYQNTKEEYIKKFFREKLNLDGIALDTMIKLTSTDGHLPTGAPSSPILSLLTHKEIFDEIYKKSLEENIIFSLYLDDITLSSNKPIPYDFIQFIKNKLHEHGLWLKTNKIKKFGYKSKNITGIYINQAGQIKVPWRIEFAFIKKIKAKNIEDMNIEELQKCLGLVSYIQQIEKGKFKVSRLKIIKALKKKQRLDKENSIQQV